MQARSTRSPQICVSLFGLPSISKVCVSGSVIRNCAPDITSRRDASSPWMSTKRIVTPCLSTEVCGRRSYLSARRLACRLLQTRLQTAAELPRALLSLLAEATWTRASARLPAPLPGPALPSQDTACHRLGTWCSARRGVHVGVVVVDVAVGASGAFGGVFTAAVMQRHHVPAPWSGLSGSDRSDHYKGAC